MIRLGPSRRKVLPVGIKHELIRCLFLAPLMAADLRAEICPLVTASDASEFAQGACVSGGLTDFGVSEILCDAAGTTRPGDDSFGIITVGDELGGLRAALDFLRIRVAAHGAVVGGHESSRLHQMTWPDAIVQEADGDSRGGPLRVGSELVRGFSWRGLHLQRVLLSTPMSTQI